MGAILEVSGIVKSFPGVKALKGVSLRVEAGEVVALLGENGAGKSTLMKILAGVQAPDAGEIQLNGAPVSIPTPAEAISRGISLIHQELNLAPNLSVAANLFLGREPRRFGFVDERAIASLARALLARVGLEVAPSTPVADLSIAQQQLVEIAKALSAEASVLIMDEPTSSLSENEARRLFEVVRELREAGVGIVYISHRLHEILELADRAVILRDGELVGELGRAELSHERMVSLMVGRDLEQFYGRTERPPGKIALSVSRLRTRRHPACELSFELREGEIVGLAGLVGAGRTELLETLFGVVPPLAGGVLVGERILVPESPRHAIRAGLALVPEDRKAQGLVLDLCVRENLALASLERDGRRGFVNRAAAASLARSTIEDLRIKTPSPAQIVRFLSGGNQQKVVLGKWLAMRPKVLLLDEPTRGVDVGAKREIYAIVERLAESGVAVLFVSSEMEEVLGFADRLLVMHEGRIAGGLERSEMSEEAVLRLATGGGGAAAAA